MKEPFNRQSAATGICLVAIGNTLRGDDGAAEYVCRRLQEMQLPVTVIVTHQLDTVLAEKLATFKKVVLVDASVQQDGVNFKALAEDSGQVQSFSHQLNAALIASLARKLYAANTQFYICEIGAVNFEMGSQLSEPATKNAAAAVSILAAWISGHIQ